MSELQSGIGAPTMTLDQLVENYVKIRDAIKLITDDAKAKTDKANKILEALNGQIVQSLNAIGADSVSTPHGTAYKTTKKTASIGDKAAFSRFVIAGELWDLLDWKANATATEDFIKENEGTPPPGVNFSQFVQAGVRRS